MQLLRRSAKEVGQADTLSRCKELSRLGLAHQCVMHAGLVFCQSQTPKVEEEASPLLDTLLQKGKSKAMQGQISTQDDDDTWSTWRRGRPRDAMPLIGYASEGRARPGDALGGQGKGQTRKVSHASSCARQALTSGLNYK